MAEGGFVKLQQKLLGSEFPVLAGRDEGAVRTPAVVSARALCTSAVCRDLGGCLAAHGPSALLRLLLASRLHEERRPSSSCVFESCSDQQ